MRLTMEPSVILVVAKGASRDVVAAFTALGNAVDRPRVRLLVDDPAKLASGEGMFAFEVSDLDQADARAAAQAMIDQVPNGASLFTIVEQG